MAKTQPRLGRGLSALIGNREVPPGPTIETGGSVGAAGGDGAIRHLPIDQLHPNPAQPRTVFEEQALQQLAESIRQKGVLQPVLVRERKGVFQIVAGERRWRAAGLAGLTEIPAIVRDLSDAEAVELALVENLQREDLTPFERAVAYRSYLDTIGGSPEDLATRIGQSRSNVINYLRLLQLAPEVRAMLEAGELGMGHARAVTGITDPAVQLGVARLAVRRNLSVRQVEDLARRRQESPETRAASQRTRESSGHEIDVERHLSRALGVPVRLLAGRRKNSGRIVIRFANLEEFDRIAERLSGSANME